MNKLVVLPFILFFSTLSAQQSPGQLEKNVLESFKINNTNYDFVKALSVIDTTITLEEIDLFKSRIDQVLYYVPPKEEKDRREEKRVKKIYDLVHRTFFKKYEDLAYFPQIFENGIYNCVTATALYAHIFDRLEIPYIVKDAPSHVYMIAYPNTMKIYLETTVPGKYGFSTPKDSEIQQVVQEMLELKLVTPAEVNEKGAAKIYQDYFFGEEELDKTALVGMQYYNKALELHKQQKNREAFEAIQKSLFFYSYPHAEYLNKFLISVNLSERNYNTEEDIDFLYTSFSSLTYGEDFQENDLKQYLYKIVHHDKNSSNFLEFAAEKLGRFNDDKVNSLSKEFIYDYLARRNASKENLDEAIRTSDSIFKYNPVSKIAEDIVAYAVQKKLSLLPASEASLQNLDEYNLKYNFLSRDRRFETIRAMYYGQLAVQNFEQKREKEGKEYLQLFGDILSSKGDLVHIPITATSELYLKAGRYYYGKSQISNALKIFEQGLAFDPSNQELKKMVQWASEDLKK